MSVDLAQKVFINFKKFKLSSYKLFVINILMKLIRKYWLIKIQLSVLTWLILWLYIKLYNLLFKVSL